MAQPTFDNLFGTAATFNATTQKLEIPLAALQSSGLSSASPTALEAFAAIVKNANGWLVANTDETVMASSDLNVFAPTTRNSEPKTQFNYSVAFYGSYAAPTFDPDEV